ncbi:twin-arginine translocase TatA/TatE family subunit [Streptomyces sp. NPDC001515]
MFGISELAIVLIVVVVVLGAKKLPELARSAGSSARILKAEARALKHQDDRVGDGPATPRVIPGETVSRRDTGQGPPA